jgi:hypothetical protein
MRLKLTLCLLLANVAVFFVLWRLDRAEVNRSVVENSPIAADLTNLDHITVSGRLLQGETRELTRVRGDGWRIVQPVDWPANDFAVQNLINQLQFMEQETSFPESELASSGQTLDDYGLKNPSLDLALQAGGRTAELLIGAPTKLGGQIYVMNKADRVIRVVAQELLQSLLMPMEDLRNPRIFSLPYFDITGLSVRGSPPSTGSPEAAGTAAAAPGPGTVAPLVKLEKVGDQWQLDTPVQCAADTSLVNGVVAQLDTLTVNRFLAPTEQDPAREGLADPSLRVTLEGNGRETLVLGDQVPPPAGNLTVAPAANPPTEYFAKLESAPTIFTVDARPFEILRNAQESLRETRFLDFDPAKVSALTIQRENQQVRIQKLESGADPWQVLAPDASGAPLPLPADTAVVEGLLDALRNLQAVHFASDAPSAEDLHTFGLTDADAQRIVTLQTDQPIKLLVGVRTDTTPVRYYAKLEGEPFVYEIGPAVLDELQLNPLSYRNHTIEALPAVAQVASLDLTDLASNQTVGNYALGNQTAWPDALGQEPPAVRTAVLALVDAVRKFQVANYLQAGFTQHFSLDATTPVPWRYRLDAGVTLPGASTGQPQAQTLTFYFSDRLGGAMQIGGTPQPAMIFILPQPVIDALYTLTLARTPPAIVQKGLREMDQPIDNRAPPPAATPPSPTAPTPPLTTPPPS